MTRGQDGWGRFARGEPVHRTQVRPGGITIVMVAGRTSRARRGSKRQDFWERLMTRSGLRVWSAVAMLAVAVGSIACATPDSRSEDERKADQAVAKQVQVALANEPYVDVAHINVAADRGVVRLSGLVATEFDLRQVLRTSAQVPGVRNVVDDLEIMDFGRRR